MKLDINYLLHRWDTVQTFIVVTIAIADKLKDSHRSTRASKYIQYYYSDLRTSRILLNKTCIPYLVSFISKLSVNKLLGTVHSSVYQVILQRKI